jgi:Plasmid encoded RepA protein
MTERKKKPATRVHPEERARIKAMNSMATLLHGAAPQKSAISYYTPELIQCTLPHSDPKKRDWIRTSGGHTLIVSSGIDKKGEPFGVPYGSFPRLVLAYIITHVVKTGAGRIEFKSFFRTFLKEVGYTVKPSVRHAKTLQNGLERLIYASITYEFLVEGVAQGERGRRNFIVAPSSMLFWNYKSPDQGSLWDSYIEISEEFRQCILDAPVPLRTDMLAALKKSPLAIDLYMWLSYRLYTLQRQKQESLTLGYGKLQEQFGTSIATDNYRNFRHELRLAFDKVKAQWETLAAADGKPGTVHCEMGEANLTLYRSPLLIARKEEKALPAAAPSARTIDPETLRKARQLAGDWDIKALAEDYFEWIARKQIEPKHLQAHFLDFVRTHRDRN